MTAIDPGPLPRPTSASNDISKAVRMDYGADELYVAMAEAALEGWNRWNERWGAPLYHQDGFLVLAAHTMRPGEFEHDSFVLLRDRGHRIERLVQPERHDRFPAWSARKYPDGYFNPRGGWVESGKVVVRLASEARAAGVRLLEQVQFARSLEDGDRVVGIRTSDGGDIHADVVLVTAGAWTPTLVPQLAGVMWATGQAVIHCKVTEPAAWQPPRFPVWAADISSSGWYGFPAIADGILKIARHGAGRRLQPDDPRTLSPGDEALFREFIHESLPALADAPIVTTRLCLYCDTFDGNFWIDRDPDRPGLIVAAGDSGHAFKFAPVLGGLIADVVEGKPHQWAARFRWRDRRRDAKEAARSET